MPTATHLTQEEVCQLREWQGETPTPSPLELHKKHKAERKAQRMKPLCLTAFRNFLRGRTYNKVEETRGRKRSLGPRAVAALNKKRRELVSKSNGEREVRWSEIIKKARVKAVHPATAKKSLQRAGIPVAARRPREKPSRKSEHIDERAEVCRRWRYLPNNYFNEEIDLIIDNKNVEAATTPDARAYKRKMKVRFQHRIRGEGLEPQYTKPNPRRNRKNLGGSVTVCAGVRNNKVVLWKYIEGKWNGAVAESVYRNDIAKVLGRHAPTKEHPSIIEDNDPTGYKSSKAKKAKKELGYRVVSLPRYSPDLNPLDFFLWNNIEQRMEASAPKGKESMDQFKKRLRKTAMSTSKRLLGKAVASIKKRAKAIHAAGGGDIDFD